MLAVGGVVIIAVAAVAGVYVVSNQPTTTVAPLSTPPPTTVAIVHSGPAELSLVSLTVGGTKKTIRVPGAPDVVVETPDRSRAFLLDTDHGDVVPVNLRTGKAGSRIPAGKLPVDEEMSADGSTLYVTDNLGGTVIPINTATGKAEAAVPLSQGVSFYVPSPAGSGALVGVATSSGRPGVVYLYSPAAGLGTPVTVGVNRVQSGFFSPDGTTAWVDEAGINGAPGALIPIDVATRKPGAPLKLGIAPGPYALSPDGRLAVFGNEVDSTLSIVDLAARAVVASVPVGVAPSGVGIDAAGTTAWVASALDRTLIPVNLQAFTAGAPVSMGNSPGDLVLPAGSGLAWVLFPSSDGALTLLEGAKGPLGRSIPIGNAPDVLVGSGSETSWVANSLTDTVQRLDVAGQTAGSAIKVFLAPTELKLTLDGLEVVVLSYGDGRHAGMLTEINTVTSKPSTPLNIGPGPGDLTMSPAKDVAFVDNYQTHSVTEIDLKNWRLSGIIPLPCGPTGLAITPDGSQLFAACANSGAVVPINLATNRLRAPIAVNSNRGLVMSPAGGTLLVVGDNGLANIDVASDTVVKSVPETSNLVDVVPTPDGSSLLAVDNSGAALLEIDATSLATEKSLTVGTRPGEVDLTPDGSRAYVLDTSEQKLYVVNVAAWDVNATVSVGPNAVSVAVPAPVVVPAS